MRRVLARTWLPVVAVALLCSILWLQCSFDYSPSPSLPGLQDPDPSERKRAIRDLCSSKGAANAIPELMMILKDRDLNVRDEAIQVLVSVGSPAVPALKTALLDPSSEMRVAALTVICKLP